MTDFRRNSLDKATSPYLQQHKQNPVWWQEWSADALSYAKSEKKLLFVSVGYATCHWCHVMASDCFEDENVAKTLNKDFVSIKIDREQRPDIDHFLMSFLVKSTGQGGWPLNAVLTPDLKPITAFTYLPPAALLDVLQQAENHYRENKDRIAPFTLIVSKDESTEEEVLIDKILSSFDATYGGFGFSQKFPPHNTLLFLLSYYEKTKLKTVRKILEKTLDAMATRGLHDHLQGGFFRYCTDAEWTIPHFEKMLYDQALCLWSYSAAYKVLGKEEYKFIAERIIKCLEETFDNGEGLFYSAHDADTEHEEGKTYLWTKEELEKIIDRIEMESFKDLYLMEENFEGKMHLIKKRLSFLPQTEERLLQARKKRKQPFTDRKIITSWNCLAGIALLLAHRYAGIIKGKEKAERIFEKIMERHYLDEKLMHSSLDERKQNEEFLEDYASLLLFATYLHEEDASREDIIKKLLKKTMEFKNSRWIENKTRDFSAIPARTLDHPVPSSVSLAELALLRAKIILRESYAQEEYRHSLERDFYNLFAFITRGNFHIIESPEKIEWFLLPYNAMQLRGEKMQDCFGTTCKIFRSEEELVGAIQ
ncbi:MAG: thioredoxin domain-containing protein [Candidatus Aenigmarchaeota archaeon]|nr:thioredoxin domain-containing protein [Candidatus Aenigmarchaeota archaeon]